MVMEQVFIWTESMQLFDCMIVYVKFISGTKYEWFVGAVFTAVYLPAGIPMAVIADKYKAQRHYILALALAVCHCTFLFEICRFIYRLMIRCGVAPLLPLVSALDII